jgi:tRNA pseudouridine55 synthase
VPEALEIPAGEIMQRPPAYSAVKVGGERLYERARRGDPVEGEPRPVTVHRSELLWHEDDRAAFELEVSSGTYVRQLVTALGDAYCDELERTAVGDFRLEDADPNRVVPLGEALGFLPAHPLSEAEASKVRNGVPFEAAATGEAVRLTDGDDLLAIARGDGEMLRPFVVFPR